MPAVIPAHWRAGGGDCTTAEVIDLAVAVYANPAKESLLRDYFDQWLYGNTKPTKMPTDFL